jgi:hypothetical protein
VRLRYATHAGVFLWPVLQVTYFNNTLWALGPDELQVCLWWVCRGLILSWEFQRRPWWTILVLPRRGPTAYEWQIGRIYGSWCHLQGGLWKRWWQLSRWSIHWEQP